MILSFWGLRHKAPYISTHMAHGDLWAFSETHLTAKDVAAFEAGLRFAGAPFSRLIGGFPVPDKRQSAGSSWKGVGILSRFPTRRLPHDWSAEIALSSRIVATTTLVDDIWVSGCAVYAEPDSHLYPKRLQHTEALLQAAISRIGVLGVGPRFIVGDWNVDKYEVPAFEVLEHLGFKEIQDIVLERWAYPVQPTCKMATRRDYCYVSPELQDLLVDVTIHHDVWPDHALLQGHFRRLSNAVPREFWPAPQPFPWPSTWDIDANLWHSMDASPTDKYQAAWKHIESRAAAALPFQPHRKPSDVLQPLVPRKPRVVSAPMSELQEKVISNHTLLALHFGMHNGSVRQDGCNPLPDQFPILSSAPMRARCGVPSSVRLGFSLILRHGGVLVKRNVLGPLRSCQFCLHCRTQQRRSLKRLLLRCVTLRLN